MATRHTFSTDYDAPFARIDIEFDYLPAVRETGPTYSSGGEPGEPASVEWIRVVVTRANGKQYEAQPELAADLVELLEDDLLEMGCEHDDEVRSFRRRAA